MRAYSVEIKNSIKRAYGTRDSHVVPHHSTNLACTGLTSQFGRDTVCYREYGRRRQNWKDLTYIYLMACIRSSVTLLSTAAATSMCIPSLYRYSTTNRATTIVPY